jgi:hypothetical protein
MFFVEKERVLDATPSKDQISDLGRLAEAKSQCSCEDIRAWEGDMSGLTQRLNDRSIRGRSTRDRNSGHAQPQSRQIQCVVKNALKQQRRILL